MPVIHFTKAKIDGLLLPVEEGKQAVYYDTKVTGLGLRVSAGGAKSYFLKSRLNGRQIKVTIGKHGVFVPDTARERAIELLAEISKGIDHAAVRAERQAKKTTLSEVLEQFLAVKQLRPKTVRTYRGAMGRCFSDWLNRPVDRISKNDVQERYEKLLSTRGPRTTTGTASAHQAMRTLRTVLNYAQAAYEDSSGKSILPENPVRRLTQAEIWRPVDVRDSYIKKQDLRAWYRAVLKLHSTTARDFLLVCLFTGLRRNEAALMQWKHIDFNEKTLTIPATNRKKVTKRKPMKALTLPLSSYVYSLLKARYDTWRSSKVQQLGDYVFPGTGVNAAGHYSEVKRAVDRVVRFSGVTFSCHDLRRTFLTIGESLDLPYLCLKRLAGHEASDITSDYVVGSVERLREPAERIAAYLKEHCGIQEQTKVPAITSNVVAMQAG